MYSTGIQTLSVSSENPAIVLIPAMDVAQAYRTLYVVRQPSDTANNIPIFVSWDGGQVWYRLDNASPARSFSFLHTGSRPIIAKIDTLRAIDPNALVDGIYADLI